MTMTIRFGGYQGDRSVHTRGARVFCAALDRLTHGEIKVDFVQNIVEGGRKAADLLAMTEAGELDGCYFSSSYLAERVPELALFDQHFAVPDRHRAYAVLDGSLGNRLAEAIEANTGYKVLGYWDNGLRQISTVDRALRDPADCEGLTIRTLASDDHQRVFRALGFTPVAIDVRDLPDAVASGKVDAQENPLTNITNFKLYETHRVVTMTGHLLGVAPVLFNRACVDNWSNDVRSVVEQALAEGTAAQRRFAEDDDETCAATLTAAGVTLVHLTDTERARFAEATRAEVETTRNRFGTELIDLFEQDLARAKA